MQIKKIPTSERPRERFLEVGESNLSNQELLSIILKTGRKGKSAKDLAIEIITKLGGIDNFKNLNINNLRDFKGIGDVKKVEILASLELGKRIYLENNLKSNKKYIDPKFIYNDNKYLFWNKNIFMYFI